MLQTDRKTETARKTAREEKESAQQKKSRETQTSASLALEAILAGSWEQLPTDGVLTLSHTLGNAALLDLFAMRDTGPETEPFSLPRGPLTTAPAAFGGGEPLLAAAPDFGAMAPMGAAAPMEM